jgi:glycerol uptake facilitator-like aquaporin
MRVPILGVRKTRKGVFSKISAGAIIAAALLYVIASGAPGFDLAKGFASNGYDAHSPGQYSMVVCFITEVVMTMMFLFVIMGATHGRAPAGLCAARTDRAQAKSYFLDTGTTSVTCPILRPGRGGPLP